MSILTDIDLKEILCSEEAQWDDKKLLIQPFSEDCLTIMGYDLRVGGYYKTYNSQPRFIRLKNGEKVDIKPGETALISTLEQIKMPGDCSISALLLSKVSQVARGLSHISTKVDPNWVGGCLSIAISNFSKETINLNYEEKICSVVFFENKSKSIKSPKAANTDRFLIAQDKNIKLWKIIKQYAPIIIIIIVPLIAYNWFEGDIRFTASIPLSVALFNFIDKNLNK